MYFSPKSSAERHKLDSCIKKQFGNRWQTSIITSSWLGYTTGRQKHIRSASNIFASRVRLMLCFSVSRKRKRQVTRSFVYGAETVRQLNKWVKLLLITAVSAAVQTFVQHASRFPAAFSAWSSSAAVWPLGTKYPVFNTRQCLVRWNHDSSGGKGT